MHSIHRAIALLAVAGTLSSCAAPNSQSAGLIPQSIGAESRAKPLESVYFFTASGGKTLLKEYASTGELIAQRQAGHGLGWMRVDPVGNLWLNTGLHHAVWIYRGGDLTKAPVPVRTIWSPGSVAFEPDGRAYLSDLGNGKKSGFIHIYAPGASVELGGYPVRGNWLGVAPGRILFVMDPWQGVRELDMRRGGAVLRTVLKNPALEPATLAPDGSLYGGSHRLNDFYLFKVPRGGKSIAWKTAENELIGPLVATSQYLYGSLPGKGGGLVYYSESNGHFAGRLTTGAPHEMQLGSDGRLYAFLSDGKAQWVEAFDLDGSGTHTVVVRVRNAWAFAVR